MIRNLFVIKHNRHSYDNFSISYYFGNYDKETDTFTFEPEIELPELAGVESNKLSQEFVDAITEICDTYALNYILDQCWLWELDEWKNEDVVEFNRTHEYNF